MPQFLEHKKKLEKWGYEILIDTDIEGFKKRVKSILGIEYEGLPNTGKVWDFRGALGLLYQEELKGYEFWGHCDFDMVFGDIPSFFPPSFYENLDIHSNHHSYICGPWTIYRNKKEVNELFMSVENWKGFMRGEPNGWVEREFSRAVEKSGLNYKYTFEQGNPYINPKLTEHGDSLFQDGLEIAMFHFRLTKRWPLSSS